MDNKTKISRINELQVISYRNGGLTQDQRNEWNGITSELEKDGIKLGRKYSYGRTIWYAKRNMKANMVCEMDFVDMSPKHKHLKGNCSTRTIAYILRDIMDYDEIESLQYTIGHDIGLVRNLRIVVNKILSKYDYVSIKLSKTIRRDKLANILSSVENPIASRSSGHIAVINNGKVVDTWDSRMGRVKEILVRNCDEKYVRTKIGHLLF